jgi:cytochrome oxidase Cu insertion factor (SCO1/SenC/PrrC family)
MKNIIALAIALTSSPLLAKDVQIIDKPGTGEALVGGDFNLVDQNGKTRTNKEFLGKYMLVYFGYSQCPDVCPTALGAMTTALEKMGEKASIIQPIFVSIDTTRDTATSLKEYSKRFHPNFLMLSGGEKEVEVAMNAYKVHSTKIKEDDGLMDHSSIIYLMDKDGKFVTSFPHSVDPVVMAQDIKIYTL